MALSYLGALIEAALLHRNPASVGISHDSCSAGHCTRDAVHGNSILKLSVTVLFVIICVRIVGLGIYSSSFHLPFLSFLSQDSANRVNYCNWLS